MLNIVREKTDLTRTGFVTNYPSFRYWRKTAAEAGLTPKPLNVYLHVPYCTQKCAYCYYKTRSLQESGKAEIDRYVAALCREIELASRRFHLKERPVTTLYVGGGTPTVLSSQHIARLMEALDEHLHVIPDPEITFEGEPVTLTQRKAEVLKDHGVNRISIGVQSFRDEVVGSADRRDREQQTLRSIEIAKQTGAVVNIDLMSGLAGETPESWKYSIAQAISTAVHSITIYKLEIFANTAYYQRLRHGAISVPSDEEEIEMIRYAIAEFRKADYLPINFFTFTRGGGYVQQHTTNNWHGEDLYAFGASGFGALGHWSYQNLSDVSKYCDAVEAGELPSYRGFVYSSLDRMVRDVMLNMKLIHLNHKEFRERHGFDLLRLCEPILRDLEGEELITVTDETISLTDKGIVYGDSVGRRLGAALEQLGGKN
ncbi:MAG: coproporphyrinogen III oxidase family protein [bacterium]|nr:coproporphyrinogen III oxidase family protein [bacterium]